MAPRFSRLLRGTPRRFVALAATAGVCAAVLSGVLVAPLLGFGGWPSDHVGPIGERAGAIRTPVDGTSGAGERGSSPSGAPAGPVGDQRARSDGAPRASESRPEADRAARERRAAEERRLAGVVNEADDAPAATSATGTKTANENPFSTKTPVIRVDDTAATGTTTPRSAPQPSSQTNIAPLEPTPTSTPSTPPPGNAPPPGNGP